MQATERIIVSQDWITGTIIVAFVLLFFMKVFKPSLLLGYAIAFFTSSFIEKRSEQNISYFSPFHTSLLLFSFITLSLAVYFVFSFEDTTKSFSNFAVVLGFLILYYALKFSVDYIVATILGIEKRVRYFVFTKYGYLHTICLWLFPLIIIYQYKFTTILFLLIPLGLLLLFRLFLILQNNKKLIFNQLFYFILYFCTLEVAPLLILYKLINT